MYKFMGSNRTRSRNRTRVGLRGSFGVRSALFIEPALLEGSWGQVRPEHVQKSTKVSIYIYIYYGPCMSATQLSRFGAEAEAGPGSPNSILHLSVGTVSIAFCRFWERPRLSLDNVRQCAPGWKMNKNRIRPRIVRPNLRALRDTAGPGSTGNGSGSTNISGCTNNQPRRLNIRPLRRFSVMLGVGRQGKQKKQLA